MSREDFLGLFLFGRFDQFIMRYLAFLKIDRAIEMGDKFGSEKAHIQWKRAEQKILYGRSLTRQQKERLEEVSGGNKSREINIVKWLIAGELTRSGQLKVNTKLRIGLSCAAILGLILTLALLSMVSNEVFTENDVGLLTAAVFVLLNGSIAVIPATFLPYRSLAPLIAFKGPKKLEDLGNVDDRRKAS